jgi:hypothetical protein
VAIFLRTILRSGGQKVRDHWPGREQSRLLMGRLAVRPLAPRTEGSSLFPGYMSDLSELSDADRVSRGPPNPVSRQNGS